MKYYGLYKITNLANGKMYIGQHVKSNIDDGYMGSGNWIRNAIQKYGIENFRKEWLGFYEDQDELNYMERVFVDQTWIDRADTYNLQFGGGVSSGPKHSESTKKLLSDKAKTRLKDKKSHPRYGMHLSEKEKQTQRLAHLGQAAWNKGKHLNLQQRQKMSESRKKYCFEHPNSTSRNRGKHWYNNGTKSLMAYSCPDGYKKGRL